MKRIVSLLLSLLLSLLILVGTCHAATVTPAFAAVLTNIIGDIDRDGTVTTMDVREYLLALVTQGSLSAEKQIVGDKDGNGKYDTADVRDILKHVVVESDTAAVRSVWLPYWEVGSLVSSGNVTTARSKIDACLQDCVDKGANTVYFHVRGNSDAYYNSSCYPVNPSATSVISKGFDPLAVAVELAHAKGLKIEAWVNPYRIGPDVSRAKTNTYFQFGSGYYYIPVSPASQQLIINGVRELVENYDIDGVHFDDYFYPENSVSNDTVADFEKADYTAYQNNGGTLSVADWRRAEISKVIAACYEICHSREGCVFGVSPSYNFDSNYNDMYADVTAWMRLPGYIDYMAPQIYVGFNHVHTPFERIIKEWTALPRQPHVKLVVGLALYKTGLKFDEWAGTTGQYEWLNNNNMMSRQINMAKQLDWDGVGLYSHLSFDIDDTRDATIAKADNDSAITAWLAFQ